MERICQVSTTIAKIIQSMKVNILSCPSVLESFHKEKSCKILNTSKNCECPYCLLKSWGFFCDITLADLVQDPLAVLFQSFSQLVSSFLKRCILWL